MMLAYFAGRLPRSSRPLRSLLPNRGLASTSPERPWQLDNLHLQPLLPWGATATVTGLLSDAYTSHSRRVEGIGHDSTGEGQGQGLRCTQPHWRDGCLGVLQPERARQADCL